MPVKGGKVLTSHSLYGDLTTSILTCRSAGGLLFNP